MSGEGTELRLRVRDSLDDAEQVEGAAREAADARHGHQPDGELAEHLEKLAAVGARAGHFFAVNLPAARTAQFAELGVEGLPVVADASVADAPNLRLVSVISYKKLNSLIPLVQQNPFRL
jgi:hypothetical protein